jgi:copper ion binding protein
MERVTLSIDGMTCGHCVRSVDSALKELAGVTVEQVQVGRATVSFDPATVSSARIAQAIESEGYGVTAIK